MDITIKGVGAHTTYEEVGVNAIEPVDPDHPGAEVAGLRQARPRRVRAGEDRQHRAGQGRAAALPDPGGMRAHRRRALLAVDRRPRRCSTRCAASSPRSPRARSSRATVEPQESCVRNPRSPMNWVTRSDPRPRSPPRTTPSAARRPRVSVPSGLAGHAGAERARHPLGHLRAGLEVLLLGRGVRADRRVPHAIKVYAATRGELVRAERDRDRQHSPNDPRDRDRPTAATRSAARGGGRRASCGCSRTRSPTARSRQELIVYGGSGRVGAELGMLPRHRRAR